MYIAEFYHIYVLTRIFRFENENSICKKVVNLPLQNLIFERQVDLQVNCNIYINLLTWMVILIFITWFSKIGLNIHAELLVKAVR